MKLIINDKYEIGSDSRNVILYEKRVVTRDGKNKGKEYKDPIGYYPSLEWALKDLLRHEVLVSEVEGVKEIIECLHKLGNDITKALKGDKSCG